MPSGPVGSAGPQQSPEHCPTGHTGHTRLQACHVSYMPRKCHERCKLLAVLTEEGQGTEPRGPHPSLTRKPLAIMEMVPGNSGLLSAAVILTASCSTKVVTSSRPDSGDRLTTSWNLSRHVVHTGMGPNPDSQEGGFQNPAGGMYSGASVSRWF